MVEAIPEEIEEDDPWNGPPRASLARRSQSYSDFYHVVRSHARDEHRLERKSSLDGQRLVERGHDVELDFDNEFAALEDQLQDNSHTSHGMYLTQLDLSKSHLETLLGSTQDTLDLLASLSDSFKSVEAHTTAFRQQCESLITEQRRQEHLADAIEENARYYTYLEPMTRRLNAPGAANLVKGDDFREMLSNLDNCLAYMESHPKHKESAIYRSRYRLLLTRALTLIRHHFTRSLGDVAADISKRVQSGQLKETTHSALLYAKVSTPKRRNSKHWVWRYRSELYLLLMTSMLVVSQNI